MIERKNLPMPYTAKTVESYLTAMETQNEDFAVENVIASGKENMSKELFDNELGFVIEKALARQLLAMELITKEQYNSVHKMLIDEYMPLIGSLREAAEAERNEANNNIDRVEEGGE